MLDMKWVRDHYDEVAEMLASRNNAFPLDRYKELDEERRKTLLRVESLKEKRNSGSKEVAVKKKAGEDTTALQNEIRALGEEIKRTRRQIRRDTERAGRACAQTAEHASFERAEGQGRARQRRDAPLGRAAQVRF